MSAYVSIDVQFKPFRLSLSRWNDGQWIAVLNRLNDEYGPPLVQAHSSPSDPLTAARVTLDGDTPRLRVGSATFAVPTRQLQRLRDWIASADAAPEDN